jgi:hypothetical protein
MNQPQINERNGQWDSRFSPLVEVGMARCTVEKKASAVLKAEVQTFVTMEAYTMRPAMRVPADGSDCPSTSNSDSDHPIPIYACPYLQYCQ